MDRAVTNPLERGVYQIDLPCELAAGFGRWRRAQKGRVHVIDLQNGPDDGTARISFVVFAAPGAFPFGKLGRPRRGEVVGVMPDWTDVALLALKQFPPLRLVLEGKAFADFVAAHTAPEFAALRDALTAARVNALVVGQLLEGVRSGAATNPAGALHQAAALVQQSLELIAKRAAAIPIAFPRAVVDEVLGKLKEMGEAIAAAPGKALAAVSKFPGLVVDNWLKPFVLPAEASLLGVAAALAGGFLIYTEGKATTLSKSLVLGGAAVALLSGGVLASNLNDLLPRAPK
jgi:hypothetical protein